MDRKQAPGRSQAGRSTPAAASGSTGAGPQLGRSSAQAAGGSEFERQMQHKEEGAANAELQPAIKRLEQQRRTKEADLEQLQQRVDKVRSFLLRRMEAAAGEQPPGSSGSNSDTNSEQQVRQLEALLQQTEVTPEQLLALLSRARLPEEQDRLVARSLGRAEMRLAVCYDLPRPGGEALAACATASELEQLGGAAMDGEQFAAALHQLVWSNPAFAQAPRRLSGAAAAQLKQLDELALRSKAEACCGDTQERLPFLPDPQTVEVWAQCPGDMEVLAPPGGLDIAALAAAAAATSGSLTRLAEHEQQRSSGSSSPNSPGGMSPGGALGGWDDVESVDDELPPMSGPAAAGAQPGQGADELLFWLHQRLSSNQEAHYTLGVLSRADDMPEMLCSKALAERLHEPQAVLQQTRQHLRFSLLGLELLRLLGHPSHAAATSALGFWPPAEAFERMPAKERELVERWGRLQSCWDDQELERVLDEIAESREHAQQMDLLLTALCDAVHDLQEPLSPLAMIISVLQLQLCQGAAVLAQGRPAGAGAGQAAVMAGYLQQVRRRLTCGALAGMKALSSSRRMVPSFLEAVSEFVQGCLCEAGGGQGQEVSNGAVLSRVGQLPLRRLLQLHAFVALRMIDNVVWPLNMDRALQELCCAARQHAMCRKQGNVRLSMGGLAAVGYETALLEVLEKLGPSTEVLEPDMQDPAVAAEQLAAYCCGLPRARAEAAALSRGEKASSVDSMLQAAEGWEAGECVRLLQATVYIRRALSAVLPTVAGAVQQGAELLDAVEQLVSWLGELCGVNGGLILDQGVRRELSVALRQLACRLQPVVDAVCGAWGLTAPAEAAVQATVVHFEQSVLSMHTQQLLVEQRAGDTSASKGLHQVEREAERLHTQAQALSDEDAMVRSLTERLKAATRNCHVIAVNAANRLEGPASTAPENMYDSAFMILGSAIIPLASGLGPAIGQLRQTELNTASLMDAALELGRALEGHLLCDYCMQPSLRPVFEALSRHLLALKWQDDMAAEEAAAAAEAEARRLASVNEEDSSSQDKEAQAQRRAKRAAKKERRAAAVQAADAMAADAAAGNAAAADTAADTAENAETAEAAEAAAADAWEWSRTQAAAGEPPVVAAAAVLAPEVEGAAAEEAAAAAQVEAAAAAQVEAAEPAATGKWAAAAAHVAAAEPAAEAEPAAAADTAAAAAALPALPTSQASEAKEAAATAAAIQAAKAQESAAAAAVVVAAARAAAAAKAAAAEAAEAKATAAAAAAEAAAAKAAAAEAVAELAAAEAVVAKVAAAEAAAEAAAVETAQETEAVKASGAIAAAAGLGQPRQQESQGEGSESTAGTELAAHQPLPAAAAAMTAAAPAAAGAAEATDEVAGLLLMMGIGG